MLEEMKKAGSQGQAMSDDLLFHTIYRLLAGTNLSASLKFDQLSNTIKFLDDECQQSVAAITKEDAKKKQQNEHALMAQLVSGIENQNLHIVDLMNMAKEKTNKIKLS